MGTRVGDGGRVGSGVGIRGDERGDGEGMEMMGGGEGWRSGMVEGWREVEEGWRRVERDGGGMEEGWRRVERDGGGMEEGWRRVERDGGGMEEGGEG